MSNLNVWKLLVYEKYFLHQISVNPKNSCLKYTYFLCANKSGTCSIPINKAVLRLNRVWLSQTDILAGKFFTSPFFLENILVLCQNVGISEKIPSPAPPGHPGGPNRGQSPQNGKIYFLVTFLEDWFLVSSRITWDINTKSLNAKNLCSWPFWVHFWPKNCQKRASFWVP